MLKSSNNLKSYLKIDGLVIDEFDNKIDEQNIIFKVKTIESLLKNHNINKEKVDDVFEVLIEIMQNILNYSYNTKDIQDNRRESDGRVTIDVDTSSNSIKIESSNLIHETQKKLIQKRYLEISELDEKALRKLRREKMRSKKDVHKNGAGLGFIVMALKVSKPVEIEFIPFKDNILDYKLKLLL